MIFAEDMLCVKPSSYKYKNDINVKTNLFKAIKSNLYNNVHIT